MYVPIYPIWFLLCLRARSLFFFAASNPRIKNGGFLGESKKQLYELIPAALQREDLIAVKMPRATRSAVNLARFAEPTSARDPATALHISSKLLLLPALLTTARPSPAALSAARTPVGTKFAANMDKSAKPTSAADLVSMKSDSVLRVSDTT